MLKAEMIIPGRSSKWEAPAGGAGPEGTCAEVKAGHSGLNFPKLDNQIKRVRPRGGPKHTT